jgi:HAMP domain-containing protein
MVILLFLELAFAVSMFFAVFSFIEKYRDGSGTYCIWAALICLASILSSLGAISAQILFNGGNELLAENVYKLLNFSTLLNAFFVFALIAEVFEFKRLRWAYPIIIFLSALGMYETSTTQVFLAFKNDMIQPVLTPALRYIFIPPLVVWLVEWFIFGAAASVRSWSSRESPFLSRSYLNLVYVAVLAMSVHVLTALYTYVNISWLYLTAWGFAVMWSLALFLCLSAFKSRDEGLVYSPLDIFYSRMAYKTVTAVFCAIFVFIVIMGILVGQSISSGLTKELSAIGAPREVIAREIGRNQNMVVTVGLFGAVFMLSGTFILMRAVTRPVEKLIRTLREIESGRWDLAFERFGEDEVGMLSRAFDDLFSNVKVQRDEIIKKGEDIRKSRMSLEKNNDELERSNEELRRVNEEILEFRSLVSGREFRENELKAKVAALASGGI